MKHNHTKPNTQNQSQPRARKSRLQRGQSLVEMALSMSVLILIFSGVVDLGRAFFSWVQLQSAITEGAHWAGIYPSCIANANSYNTGSHIECENSNAIDERILNEDGQLNRNNYLCVTATVSPSADAASPVPGDDVQLQAKYKVTLITPLMMALFGNTFYIYATAHETIRGGNTDLPSITPITMSDQGGITSTCTVP